MKKEDPFARLKAILSLSSPESYQPQTNKIPGERVLSRFKINEHGVVDKPKLFFQLKVGKYIIRIDGAETNKGRFIAALHYLVYNMGGGRSPWESDVTGGRGSIQAFDSQKTAVVYYLGEAIRLLSECSYCEEQTNKKIKNLIIKERDIILKHGYL